MNRYATKPFARWYFFTIFALYFLSLSWSGWPNFVAISIQEVSVLELNRPVERELAGGQSHVYQITLTSGQFLSVVVDQRGIDVVVKLIGPDSKQMIEVDSPNGEQGPEDVYLVAKTTGAYLLKVQSLENEALTGRYEVKITELREATSQDGTRIAALKAFVEAEQLQQEQTKEALLKAIAKAKEALPLWRAISSRDKEAQTLDKLGYFYFLLSDFDNALQHYSQALILMREIKNRLGEADIMSSLGAVYMSFGKYQKALESFQQAQQLCRDHGNRLEEARAIKGIGDAYNQLEDLQKAIAYYEEAISILRAAGKHEIVANALNNLASVRLDMGEVRKALESHNESLEIRRRINDRFGMANSFHNLGQIYHKNLGESQKAIEYFNLALALRAAIGDRAGEAVTAGALGDVYYELDTLQEALNFYHRASRLREEIRDDRRRANTLSSIGIIYSSLGEDQKAVDYYTQSLQLRRKVGDLGGEASTLNNLGAVYQTLGRSQEAFDCLYLALQRWNALRDRGGEARTRGNLAKVHQSLREHKQALENFEQSLNLSRTTGDRRVECTALSHLGDVYASLGEQQKALDAYNQALNLSRVIKFDSHEAATLAGIARFEQKRGNFNEARALMEKALEITNSLRAKQMGQESRAAYFGTVQGRYKFYVDLLMQQRHLYPGEKLDEIAFLNDERARARSLLELLAESRAGIREGGDAQLLQRERGLLQKLNAKAEIVSQLKSTRPRTPQASEAIEKKVADLEREIDPLMTEYHSVRTEISQKSPRYAAITQPQPLRVAEIQQQLLDADTLLLQFSLGEERSYLWAITSATVSSHELPPRNEIEKEARKLYQLFGSDIAEKDLRYRTGYRETTKNLSRMLLLPVASQLGRKRLVIVADGVLQMIPFAALFEPVAGAQRPAGSAITLTPLIVKHEIVYLPSASTLGILRQDLAGRPPAPKMVAALARPVLSEGDHRFGEMRAAEKKLSEAPSRPSLARMAVTRALEDTGFESGNGEISDLPFSEREAKHATSFYPTMSKLFLGFEANYETAINPELSQYRYIHFATHGLIDTQRPELSGILLSQFDQQCRPREQAVLRLGDIYNLNLPAELVVLSACQTALGKDVRGEGLTGLTRGFMYAGTPRVVASLWQVNDPATAELMKRFYTAMLGPKLMRPAAALRQAQLEMLGQPQTRSPYFWAAFTFQGEWR